MIQTDARTDSSKLWRRYLLVPGLISGLSLTSSGLVLARAELSSDSVVVPSTVASKPKTLEVAPPQPAPPQTAPDRVQPEFSAPAPTRREPVQPEASIPLLTHREPVQPEFSAPAPTRREPVQSERSSYPDLPASKPQFSNSPGAAVDRIPYSTAPSTDRHLVQNTASPKATATNKPAIDRNNAFIDPTDYSIGATKGYEAPNAVVLSERSTGCQAVLQQGQVSSHLCSATAIPFTAQHPVVTPTWTQVQEPNSVRNNDRPSWTKPSRDVTSTELPPVPVAASGFGRQNTPVYHGPIASGNVNPIQNGVANYAPTLPFSGLPGTVSTILPLPGLSDNVMTPSLIFPLTIPVPITSVFGWRIHPITGGRSFHSGTDLGAPLGSPVLAAYAGQVAIADYTGGYGLAVVLDHNQSTAETLYGHLSQIFVQPGQWVDQGTVIGLVGSTGNSTGPHLHFEIRQLTPQGWVATDPGAQVQYALAQLVQALRIAQTPQHPG